MTLDVLILIGQRQFWRKPSVFATRSVSEGLYLTRSLAYASGYYFGKSGDVQLRRIAGFEVARFPISQPET